MAKKKTKEMEMPQRSWQSFSFIFVGSIIFLGLAFMASSYVLNGSTSLWQPLLYAAAVIGSLMLFIANLINVMCPDTFSGKKLMKVSLVTSFSFIALTYALSNSAFFSLSIIAFIVVFIGTSMASCCDCDCGCNLEMNFKA